MAIRQLSVSALPKDQQDAAMAGTHAASERHPAVTLPTGQRLHVFKNGADGAWDVWLNCEDADFTGICVAVKPTRQLAIAEAVRVFEAAVEQLQSPYFPVRSPLI